MKQDLNNWNESQGRDKDHMERLWIIIDYLVMAWIIFLCILMSYIILV